MDTPSVITYQAQLPLQWQLETPDATMVAAARHANLGLLHALAVLETAPEKEHDADPALSKAFDRLEAKLNIALGLLSRLVAQNGHIPAPSPVTLGVHSIRWQPEAEPSPGSTIKLSLHLSPRLPEPLQIYARIVECHDGMCVADFIDQDPELEEWMTRTLFRYHRRELQARHQA